ncbi:unnamed protein product [Acanthoscelides obtectus]|uniref:Endonuclease/exonuclease/phosphatase domain-containing protein n=1 Tax=Acanthoscelides obtectus TaxID=200917 RepID=A0A9P0MBU7_ACAOB|nr:unnamed protein product [Acanthoscelides obtectus]CAK1654632.1 hypothetical protein AOBTE_LOCUS18728 [Acanthoscelides obtectus]
MSRRLKFMSFNVRSIQSGFLTLKEYVVDCAVDVLGLSETWLTPDIDSSSVFINDFNVVRADRNSRGGGVAFYVRNGIAFKILHSNITTVLEELWISVKVNQRKYCLAIVYRPPSANVLDCFHQLTESLSNLSLDNDYAIVMGDFNINVLVNDGRSEMLNCFLESFDLSQLVKEPTRITSNSQTAIDLLMVSSADIINGYEVVDVDGISDHLALIFYVDASEISNLCKLRTYHKNSTDDDILQNIRTVNGLEDFQEHEIKLVAKTKHKNSTNLILEVSPTVRNFLIDRGYVYVGWNKCQIYLRCMQQFKTIFFILNLAHVSAFRKPPDASKVVRPL